MFSKLKAPQGNELIIFGLATWRLAFALVYERGPFSVFLKLREKTGIIHNEFGERVSWDNSNIFSCVWCTSFWVSIIMYFLPKPVRYFFAASSIACIIDKVIFKEDDYGEN